MRSMHVNHERQSRLQAAGVALLALAMLGLPGCINMPPHVDNFDATLPPDEAPQASAGGAIYQLGHDVPLFENSVAHRVGDVLTITLEEKTDASKSASTNTAKNTKIDLSTPTLMGPQVIAAGRPILNTNLANATSFGGIVLQPASVPASTKASSTAANSGRRRDCVMALAPIRRSG